MKAPVPERQQMLTISTIAKDLAVSTKTDRRWIESADLLAHRFGRSVRVSADDLAAYSKRQS